MKAFNPFEVASLTINAMPDELVLAIKKTTKKDITTKSKGLEEIMAWVEKVIETDELFCFQADFVSFAFILLLIVLGNFVQGNVHFF